MKKWSELSVLIAGCGSIGKRHARVLEHLGLLDLRACDLGAKARQEMLDQSKSIKIHSSFEEGLKDKPDAVLICTPPSMHIPMAIQAIDAGCHVLIEKPLSDSPNGADVLMTLAERQNKKVMVALCFRYHKGVIKARDNLLSGRFGRLVCVRAFCGENLPEVRLDYRQLDSSKHLGALELMHDLDLALWMAGVPVKSVTSVCGNFSDIGIEAPDTAEIIIGFDGRCLASVHLDFFQKPRRRYLELMCTEGVIILAFASWDNCRLSTFRAAEKSWENEELNTQRDDMLKAEDKEFLRAVAENLPIQCSIAEGLKSVEVVSAVLEHFTVQYVRTR